MKRMLAFFAVLIVSSACQVLGGGSDSGQAEGANASTDNHPIQWDRSAFNVVFQADVVGGSGEELFYSHNRVPLCTIYGDGHIIWSNPDGTLILIEQLSDQEIRDWVNYLTVEKRIYTYRALADLQIGAEAPVVEVLRIHVNDVVHTTDAFGSWPADYFSEILGRCQLLGDEPAIYEPAGAWVSAQSTEYTSSSPTLIWDENDTGLNLQELADSGEKRWIEGRTALIIWSNLRGASPDLQFSQQLGNFHVLLEVPGVTRDAPAPPAAN